MALYVSHPASLEHDTGAHPENAGRLRAIEARLDAAGWPGLERAEAPAASSEQLELVHTAAHVRAIEELSARGGGMLDLDTVASAGSWRAALHAAGGAAWAAERLLDGDETVALCALRPPGHHAERARAMGFCLFNNVAVAAAHALACGAERVLVLDWDVHHGNGTEEIFASSRAVLYASIHQWPLYPGTGPAGYAGEEGAEGYTINMPVAPGSDGDDFLALVQHLVAPVVRALRPGLICVSAGFDAHRDDPLASCLLDESDYAEMAASLRLVAAEVEAPVLVCLEGGYAPDALSASFLATVEGLTSDREPRQAPSEPAARHIARARRHWPALAAA